MAKHIDPASTTQLIIQTIPRKTLEYFATTYTATPYSTVMELSSEQLVDRIKKCGMLSKVLDIYQETIRSVEKEKDQYIYYIRHLDHDSNTPISYEKVINALDESHLFGKAVFMLLLNVGTMETASDLFVAVKKTGQTALA